ncbi:polysaccharide biosynthesis/export family protein [Bacteroidales bacterium OttesenSCG-928-A17]|nr:polysaccharide biosynthesis/export family protein [Bacteroidales bacterium OttesenSCG-928-A17]
MKLKFTLIITIFTIILSSCTSYKGITYLKDVETLTPEQLTINTQNSVIKVKPGDALTITVNSIDPLAAAPFNLPFMPTSTEGGTITNTVGSQTYIVDDQGDINFPVLGKLHVEGLERAQVENLIKEKIYPQHFETEPVVVVRFISTRINVIGEVNKPGPLSFNLEKVDLLTVLAAAGDLTIYGKRDNILLQRRHADGRIEYARLNLQDKNLVLSPYYYLQQNDVLYVEPNKAKGNSSSIGSTENITISVVGILVSVATLLITVFNK